MIIYNFKKILPKDISDEEYDDFTEYALDALEKEFPKEEILLLIDNEAEFFETDNENMMHYPRDYGSNLWLRYVFINRER